MDASSTSPARPLEKVPEKGETQRFRGPLVVVTALFFIWGFLTCLNDILIPHLKSLFSLNYTQAMLVQFCFFSAYFLVSLPAGKFIQAVGYKRGMITGLLTAAFGALCFYPAAEWQAFGVFLFALFVLAAGITILQVSANPYVTVLGAPETASSRLNLVQAFNSLGTTVAPLFGAAFILSSNMKSGAELEALSTAEQQAYRATEAAAVQGPYVGLALALGALALLIGAFKLPAIADNETPTDSTGNKETASPKTSAWQYRHLVLGALGIFAYVGAEVGIGSFLISFLADAPGGISHSEAGQLVSLYWGGAMVGRFVGSWILTKINPHKVLAVHGLGSCVLILVTLLAGQSVARYAILGVGLFNSIMFPTIFTLAINRLGRFTSQGSGILCMAIVGGAVLPLLQGILADKTSVGTAFLIPFICYLYIMFYALKGSKPAL